ncbi:MAG TPA: ATP-binding protein [Gemmatimonadaceae bacterium]|nr:ATP-binding protein [Gemmatimonadaceae bacterium]
MTSESLELLLAALVAIGLTLAIVFGRIGARQYEAATERERELRLQADDLRHQAEEARRRIAAILDGLPDAATAFDAQWRWLYLNPAAAVWLRRLGKDPDQVVGHIVWEDFPDLVGTPFQRAMMRAVAEHQPVEHLACYEPTGSWIEQRVVPVPEGVVAFARDVTERIRLHDALRDEARVLATLQEIGSMVAAELNLPRLARVVVEEATALVGATLGAFFYRDPDAPEAPLQLVSVAGASQDLAGSVTLPDDAPGLAPVLAGAAPLRLGDLTPPLAFGTLADGLPDPLGSAPARSVLAVPITSHSGAVLGVLYLLDELPGQFSERHQRIAHGIASWAAVALDNARLYEAERGARAEAQVASRAKSDFLATMSHELRTPLNAIAGYTELLTLGVRGPMNEVQRDYLDRIQRAQHELLALINDVLNFVKAESGRLRFAMQEVPARELIDGLEALFGAQMTTRHIAYEWIPGDDDAFVHADPDRARQVLQNLISNAVKFTPPGGQITVRAAARGDTVRIIVRDTGVGVAAEKLEFIFEPFVQLDRDLASPREGAGLGLAISRDLARAMGGDITARSTPGKGSTFTLALPRARNIHPQGGGASAPPIRADEAVRRDPPT